MTRHAILSPSAASRWFACPGSLWLSKNEQDETSPAAAEGTAAHALAEYCLKFGKSADSLVGKKVTVSPINVDEDMATYVQRYVDNIKGICDSIPEGQLLVEQELDLTDIIDLNGHFDDSDNSYYVPLEKETEDRTFGTADAIIIGGGVLQIHDLKYGKGVRVTAQGNKQLLIYAVAAHNLFSLIEDIETISMHIHQVRLNSFTEWTITVEELVNFREELKKKARRAYQIYANGPDDSPDCFTPGDAQCQFCPAKAACPTLAQHVLDTVAGEFADLTQDLEPQIKAGIDKLRALDNNVLANIYGGLDLVDSFTKAVRTRVSAELNAGNEVPGYKLVLGRAGSRAWASEEGAEQLLKSFRLKTEQMYNFKLISPTQAEKILKESPRRWTKAEQIIVRPEGKPTIAPESDKRPAIVTDVSNDFEDVTQEENKNEINA